MLALASALLALLPAHALRCELRVHLPTACARRVLRSAPLHLSSAADADGRSGGGGGSGGGDLDGDLEAALRKALSEMPTQELIDSDRRLLDGLVEEAQTNDLSAFESNLDRELASVQGAAQTIGRPSFVARVA